jgi:hypothetical protein
MLKSEGAMARELFAKDIEEKVKLFYRAFDRPADLLTAVLRGHMMVEERLHDVISAGVASYVRPYDENDIFSFGTAAKLAQAIVGSAADFDLWKATKSLNALRNAIGHRYEPTRLDGLITKFFKDTETTASSVFKNGVIAYLHKGESDQTHAIVVRMRCMAMWSVLGIHADNLAKDLDNALMSRRQ